MNLLKTILPNQLLDSANVSFTSTTSQTESRVVYSPISIISGHKYYFSFVQDKDLTSAVRNTIYIYANGQYLMMVAVIGLNKGENGVIRESSVTATGAAEFWCHTPSDTVTHSKFQIIDLTELYGQGAEPSTVQAFKQDFPLDYYPYRTTSTPALVTANNAPITADISSMLPSGIIATDLGALTWNAYPDRATTFYAWVPNKSTEWGSSICEMYTTTPDTAVVSLPNMSMRDVRTYNIIYIRNDNYSTPESFKAGMSGVLLFSKKA